MAKYSIRAPNGQTYQIDGPDGASDDQVRAEVMRQHPGADAASAAKKPATALSTAGRMAWNLPGDTVDAVKGLAALPGQAYDAITHPAETAHAVGGMVDSAAHILQGGMQHVRELSPKELQGSAPKMDTAEYDKFAEDNYSKYGTKQNIYKTVGDHPLAPTLAIASILAPALKIPAVAEKIAAAKTALTPAKRIAPASVKELKTASGGMYDEAKKEGVVIKGESFKNFKNGLQASLRGEGLDTGLGSGSRANLHPNASAVLGRIIDASGDGTHAISLNDLEILRKVATDATETANRPDKRLARIAVDHIDDYQHGLKAHDIVAGDAPKAVALLDQARATWKDAARGETIDKLIAKAQAAGGAFKGNLDASYRQQFKKLANNDRGIARFTPEQQEAIRKVAFGDGKLQAVMHTVGRLIPSSNSGLISTSAVGTAAHFLGVGPATEALAAGAGVVGKIGSTIKTSKNAQRAAEMARTGSKITPRSDAYYKIQQRRAARTGGSQFVDANGKPVSRHELFPKGP